MLLFIFYYKKPGDKVTGVTLTGKLAVLIGPPNFTILFFNLQTYETTNFHQQMAIAFIQAKSTDQKISRSLFAARISRRISIGIGKRTYFC